MYFNPFIISFSILTQFTNSSKTSSTKSVLLLTPICCNCNKTLSKRHWKKMRTYGYHLENKFKINTDKTININIIPMYSIHCLIFIVKILPYEQTEVLEHVQLQITDVYQGNCEKINQHSCSMLSQ